MAMPPEKTELERQYKESSMRYEALRARIVEILQGVLKREQIRTFVPIISRVKEFESFYDKIKRKSYTDDFFDRVEDIAGVRVICIYFDDLERIEKLIANHFTVVKKDRKTLSTAVEESGYLSDHYIVKLSESNRLASDQELMEIKCEIQVRTLLMHGWATVSHELNYKKEIGLSEKLLREMGTVVISVKREEKWKGEFVEQIKKNLHQELAVSS